MQPPSFEQVIGAIMGVGSLAVISFLAITGNIMNESGVVVGALISTLTMSANWFIRGRVQEPTQ